MGSHAGYALVSQGLAEEIVYIDVDVKKAEAQALDIFDSTVYLQKRAIVRAGDYSDAKDADLMIVAAGPLPDMSKGQTRMDTLRQTIAIIKDVAENIRNSGFLGIILNISNPADVVTHYLQHVLDWAPERILSTSTTLDSSQTAQGSGTGNRHRPEIRIRLCTRRTRRKPDGSLVHRNHCRQTVI